jgi:hypothetical protein
VKTKTREEIRIETRELKRTAKTDGCYNPFNLCNPEVQRRLEEHFVEVETVKQWIQNRIAWLKDTADGGTPPYADLRVEELEGLSKELEAES